MKRFHVCFLLIPAILLMIAGCHETPVPEVSDSATEHPEQTGPVIIKYPEPEKITDRIDLENGSSFESLWIPEGYTKDKQIIRDFDQDGTEDILEYTTEPMEEVLNFSTTISLRIGEAEIRIDEIWNDGLHLYVFDFDTSDKYIDICITQFSTDVGCTTHIYRYENKNITEYASFIHTFGNTLYADGSGKIYCNLDGSDPESANGYFDYREKVLIEL